MGRKIAGAIVKYAEENHADVIVFEYLEMQGRYPERKSRNCICGENGISRSVVNIRHTEKECAYPESVHGIQAGLRMMVLEMYPVTRRITVFVYSRQENNITVICRHRIISGKIFYQRTFKTPSGNGKVFAGGKSPSGKA